MLRDTILNYVHFDFLEYLIQVANTSISISIARFLREFMSFMIRFTILYATAVLFQVKDNYSYIFLFFLLLVVLYRNIL